MMQEFGAKKNKFLISMHKKNKLRTEIIISTLKANLLKEDEKD